MQVSDNKAFGGGGHKRPKRDTINRRTISFIENKLKTSPQDLKPQDRQNIVYVLYSRFEYTIREIMNVIPISKATMYRDIERVIFLKKRSVRLQKELDRIWAYIIYIDRYI